MARSFLPKAGQVREVLAAADIHDHPKFGRSRLALVAQAKKFVDTIQFEKDGKTHYVNRAFHPEQGSGVAYVTGGARIALDLMYSLFVAAPADSVKEAIAWALNEAPMHAVHEYDLGEDRKTGNRRVGLIGQAAYQMALEYFEAGMELELNEFEKRLAAKRDERHKAGRENAFRNVTSQSIGSLLTDEQKKAMRKGRPEPR